MASNYVVLEGTHRTESVREIAFAGDTVRLAGQIDYPTTQTLTTGFPLLFVIPQAGCNTRDTYTHFAQTALDSGFAVFRWDKRGTGRSGAGGRGSATMDAVLAYETALEQPRIDGSRVIILAQGDGTTLLGNAFGMFARVQAPLAVILAGNMLDPDMVTAINARLYVVQGDTDWNDWKIYAKDAVTAHQALYDYGASYYVARNANRLLMVNQGTSGPFHFGAKQQLKEWLRAQ
ncbi:MAG: hypothetical protein RLP44_20260 [Aggregatilineales bacterium]